MRDLPNPIRPHPASDSAKPRVLLVDDDSHWLVSLALLLRNEGYAVETTTEGQTALERLKRGDIDLLILDLSMPSMSGSELLGAMPRDGPRPAVIIASGSDDAGYVTGAMRRGADEYIKKPCTLQELRIRIANAAEKRKLRRLHTENQKALKQLAWFDPVTRLPNRRHLEHELEMRMARARRTGGRIAILFIDLDHFKRINDTFGHAAGDSLLAQVPRRLESALRQYDFLARYGGDELVLLLSDEDAIAVPTRIAGKIIGLLEQPFQLNGQAVNISASIGISLFPEDGSEGGQLLQRADAAMYQVKAGGRNAYSAYSTTTGNGTDRQAVISQRLSRALQEDAIELLYQPQVDLRDHSFCGCEALVRWEDEELGDLSPQEFFPIAEKSDLADRLGEWVIDRACRDLARWRRDGVGGVRAAINVSARQLTFGDLTGTLSRVLRRYRLTLADISLEINEILLIQADEATLHKLRALRSLGCRISMDGFGTGYSSLGYLKQLPVDLIKIDRQLIAGIPENPQDCALIDAAAVMAHSLGIKVLATGIETWSQQEYVTRRNYDLAQGFWYSRPLWAEQAAQLIGGKNGVINND